MKRLTRQPITQQTGFVDIVRMINKLTLLEDLEEELGIDLITLYKAKIADTIYTKWNDKIIELNGITELEKYSIDDDGRSCRKYWAFMYYDTFNENYCLLKDYGKTWALTKEELENVK